MPRTVIRTGKAGRSRSVGAADADRKGKTRASGATVDILLSEGTSKTLKVALSEGRGERVLKESIVSWGTPPAKR